MSKQQETPKILKTPISILSYPHLAAPQKASEEGQKDKYSAALLITEETLKDPREKALFDAIKGAMAMKIAEKFGDRANAVSKSDGFKKGLRFDAESKNYPDGVAVYFTARSESQPGLVYSYPDPETGKPMKVAQDDIKKVFYPGAIVRGLVSVYAFDKKGGKGVGFGLTGVQFVRAGDRIDNRVNAEDAFEADLSQAPADLNEILGLNG